MRNVVWIYDKHVRTHTHTHKILPFTQAILLPEHDHVSNEKGYKPVTLLVCILEVVSSNPIRCYIHEVFHSLSR
jgi:hypothetical protein